MSIKCEICGKEFKTSQGLRGHKTFVHKITSSSAKSPTPLATEQLEQHTRQLAELSVQLKELSQQVKLAANSTEVHVISRQVAQLSEHARKHDRWLTTSPAMLFLSQKSPDCPAFLLDLNRLKERVDDHQSLINLTRRKLNN